MEHLRDMDCDICLIQKTFLKDADTAKRREIEEYGWKIASNPRKHRSGGGICVLYKPCISLKCNDKVIKFKTFQVMETTLQGYSEEVRFVNIYRPPYTKKARFTEAQFLEEFDSYLDDVSGKPGMPIIGGDFNIHIERPTDHYPQRYLNLLAQHDLHQCVPLVPTHDSGGTLDHIITTEKGKDLINNLVITADGTPSDHFLVSFDLSIDKVASQGPSNSIQYRNFAAIDVDLFREDLK